MQSNSQNDERNTRQLGLFGEVDSTLPIASREAGQAVSKADEIIRRGLDHLNTVTERTGAARFTSPTSIKARVQDGATLEDVLLVIDFCHAMWWGDPKMETFVRPKTLFGKENFPDYLARARKWRAEGRPSLVNGPGRHGRGDRSVEVYTAHVKGGSDDPGSATRL